MANGFPLTVQAQRQESAVLKWLLTDIMSRSEITIASSGSDQILEGGTVLGLSSLGTPTSAAKSGGNTGTGSVGSLSLGTLAKLGAYTLTAVSVVGAVATFAVTDPFGRRLADAVTGVAYAQPDLNFTISQGATIATTGAATAIGTNTGNGTFGAITVTPGSAQLGNYVVEMDSATTFIVSNPLGIEIGHGSTGVAFSGGGIGFTITAGGTPFAAGDSFNVATSQTGGTDYVVGDGFVITVPAGTGYYTPLNLSAVDGSQNAAAVLTRREFVTASTTGDCQAVTGFAVVNSSALLWPSGITNLQIAAALSQLAAKNIFSRAQG